ncbi:MAG: hypothetical protein F7B60_02290 [Desulfurococcales archaeon]|nr:hypothetical protein [Desulfurococcales archaeon]
MKNKKMGAIVPLLLLAVLAVGMFGGAMALWWERLNVDVTVNTGSLDAQLSVEGSGDNEIALAQAAGEDDPTVKNVSYITCTLAEDGNSIDIVVENAYPSITYYCDINLENTGTIPFKVYGTPTIEGNITSVLANDSGLVNGTIYDGLQMHPGDIVYDTIVIHLTNDALENSVYTGHMNITVEQWNEYPATPPS